MNARLLLSVSILALTACSQEAASVPDKAASAVSEAAAPTVPAASETEAVSATAASAPASAFNLDSLPISTVPLGKFPYISLPENYKSLGLDKDSVQNFARFPFWVGDKEHWVEGKIYSTPFSYYEGKEMKLEHYSSLEVQKNLESVVTQLGGTKVFEGKIPASAIDSWMEGVRANVKGIIDITYDKASPIFTYVVRRNDGNIWISYIAKSTSGYLVIAQEKGFEATAKILAADELKKQIDSTGKVDLQVNFATDKTDILPESQPQIDEVYNLLQADPELKLSINGHTDSTGSKAHNQSLSEGRAHSVVATLISRGIAADRMKAAGFGDTRPVADNETEEGKAKNRRVELVKQ